MTTVNVNVSRPFWSGLLVLGAVGSVACFFVWKFFAGIIFFGLVAGFYYLAGLHVYKMKVDEEERRIGKKMRAICGYIGLIALGVVLFSNSAVFSTDEIDENYVRRIREDLYFGYGMALFFAGVCCYIPALGVVRLIREKYSVDPPLWCLYLLALLMATSSTLILVGLLSSRGLIYVPLSDSLSLRFNIEYARPALFAVFMATHLVMSRLRFLDKECATVYLFGVPVYQATKHGDLILPPLFPSLILFTDALGQNPFGFSMDFGTLRESLQTKRRIALIRERGGEHEPVQLGGGNGGTSQPDRRLPSPPRAALTPPSTPKREEGPVRRDQPRPPSPSASPQVWRNQRVGPSLTPEVKGGAATVAPAREVKLALEVKEERRELPPIEPGPEWKRRMAGASSGVASLGKDALHNARMRSSSSASVPKEPEVKPPSQVVQFDPSRRKPRQ